MQKILSRLCAVSSFFARIGLVAIAVIILAQVVARPAGIALPSTDDFAAWAMAATVFLALPGAFFDGNHIRVTLAVDRLGSKMRHVIIRAGNILGFAVMATACWFVATYVIESYIYHDMSQGAFAVPLWIPQVFMLFGMALCLPVMLWLIATGTDHVTPAEVRHDT